MKTNNHLAWNIHDLFIAFIALIPVILAAVFYKDLPNSVAIHFGVSGEPDNYTSKSSFIIVFFLMNLGIPLLMKFSKFMDPRKQNYEKFGKAYLMIRYLIALIIAAIGVVTLLFNLGYDVNIQMMVLLGIGILFIGIGNYMVQLRSNFFVGIRTPWTLTNDVNWRKTHRLAGPLWMGAGVILLICAFLPGKIAMFITITVVVIIALIPMIYSYILLKNGNP
ncbi:SdpI family protein [Falsibacillus pallidus]|uniref:SdpI family protein n=1 Tax=Falsibacillus pallidus TaxID=493781 RepID=UPI003D99ADD8